MFKELSFDVWVALTKCRWVSYNWPSLGQGQKQGPFRPLFFSARLQAKFLLHKTKRYFNWLHGPEISLVCGKEDFLAFIDLVKSLNVSVSLHNQYCPGYTKVGTLHRL